MAHKDRQIAMTHLQFCRVTPWHIAAEWSVDLPHIGYPVSTSTAAEQQRYGCLPFCHTSNSHLSTGANGEAMQVRTILKTCIFYYKSCENQHQVLQVTCAAPECAMN